MRMREPYVEGVATHDGPESCAGTREGVGEAFDRGTRGLGPWNRETREMRGADAVSQRGRPHDRDRSEREISVDLARSKTPVRAGSAAGQGKSGVPTRLASAEGHTTEIVQNARSRSTPRGRRPQHERNLS